MVPSHSDGGQAQFIPEPVSKTCDGGLALVLDWLEATVNRELSVAELARRAAMSTRTFARQFRRQTGTTPHQWLTHLHLLAAQRRFEQTNTGMDAIAESVGWQTAAPCAQSCWTPKRAIRTASIVVVLSLERNVLC